MARSTFLSLVRFELRPEWRDGNSLETVYEKMFQAEKSNAKAVGY